MTSETERAEPHKTIWRHLTDIHPEDDAESPVTDEAPAAPARERRTGSLLSELTFLDD